MCMLNLVMIVLEMGEKFEVFDHGGVSEDGVRHSRCQDRTQHN